METADNNLEKKTTDKCACIKKTASLEKRVAELERKIAIMSQVLRGIR